MMKGTHGYFRIRDQMLQIRHCEFPNRYGTLTISNHVYFTQAHYAQRVQNVELL